MGGEEGEGDGEGQRKRDKERGGGGAEVFGSWCRGVSAYLACDNDAVPQSQVYDQTIRFSLGIQ